MQTTLLLTFICASAAAELQAVLDEMRIEQDVPGISATVVRRGEEVWSGGSGVADIETATPMTGDTRLYAGSLSKVFTSSLVLALVQQEEMLLDDRISRLLTHTSGLDREGNFNYWFTAEFPDRIALSHYLDNAELRSNPGEKVSYSNIGFAALGLAIEDVTGLTYADALRKYLLEPLALHSTGAPGPVEGIARGYTPPGRVIPDAERPFAGVGKPVGDRRLREYHDARAMSPAFGLYSTTTDLGRLASFVLGYGGSNLIPDGLRRRLIEPQRGSRSLGLRIGERDGRHFARHGGWFAAHRSYLLLDLDNDIGIAVIGNADNTDAAAIANALHELLVSE